MTNSQFPLWADADLSAELPLLRAKGEGQTLEYIELFPSNAQELAREVAALATSGGGTILLGVDDEGGLTGLNEALSVRGRDEIVRRIEGICRGPVKPAITPTVRIGWDAGVAVVVLVIPRGSQPMYYCNGKPYVRHLSESRPAEPHEVIEKIHAWLNSSSPQSRSSLSEALSAICDATFEVIEGALSQRYRRIAPFSSLLQAQFNSCAERLRSTAATDEMQGPTAQDLLLRTASSAQACGVFIHTLGSGPTYRTLVEEAASQARLAYQYFIAQIAPTPSELEGALELLRRYAREVSLLRDAMPSRLEAGQDFEVQDAFSQVGYHTLRMTYFGLRALPHDLKETLRSAARHIYAMDTLSPRQLRGKEGSLLKLSVPDSIELFIEAADATASGAPGPT